jgi:hypothetical protein
MVLQYCHHGSIPCLRELADGWQSHLPCSSSWHQNKVRWQASAIISEITVTCRRSAVDSLSSRHCSTAADVRFPFVPRNFSARYRQLDEVQGSSLQHLWIGFWVSTLHSSISYSSTYQFLPLAMGSSSHPRFVLWSGARKRTQRHRQLSLSR